MKKMLFSTLLLLLTLTACTSPASTPTPLPTPTVGRDDPIPPSSAPPASTPEPIPTPPADVDYKVQEGDDLYTVRLRGTLGDYIWFENYPILGSVDIYKNGDFTAPVQTLDNIYNEVDLLEGRTIPFNQEVTVQDVNFDGWPDFFYLSFGYRIPQYGAFLWNPVSERFESYPDLPPYVTVDPEKKLLFGLCGGAWGYTQSAHRWTDGSLERWMEFSAGTDGEGALYNRFVRWENGEEVESKEWHGEAPVATGWRILPGAEPYEALTRPPETEESFAPPY